MKKACLVLLSLLLFSACSSSSIEELKDETNALVLEMIDEMKTIKTKEDLLAKEKPLTEQFLKLADLMIRASALKQEEKDEKTIPSNDKLKKEIERLYTIDGGTLILESYQSEALKKLEKAEGRQKNCASQSL